MNNIFLTHFEYVGLYRVPPSERVRDIISSHLTSLRIWGAGAYFSENERVNNSITQVINLFAIQEFSNSLLVTKLQEYITELAANENIS